MSIRQVVQLAPLAIIFAGAYSLGMKMLLEYSLAAPFIVTAILTAGTLIALKKVKREAEIEGSRTEPYQDKGSSLLKSIFGLAIMGTFTLGLFYAAQFSPVLFVAGIEIIVFGFMIALAMVAVFAHTEMKTKARLAAKGS